MMLTLPETVDIDPFGAFWVDRDGPLQHRSSLTTTNVLPVDCLVRRVCVQRFLEGSGCRQDQRCRSLMSMRQATVCSVPFYSQ